MSKRQAKHVPPTGELRQSQLLTTFGPGSMVDLPNHAVLNRGPGPLAVRRTQANL